MPSSEVKQRKKASSPLKQNEDAGRTTKQSCEKHEMKVGGKPRSAIMSDAERSSGLQLEMKTSVCLLSAIACMALAWLLLQQNARFSVIEEKYTVMYKKTEDFQELYDKISKVSKKSGGIQAVLGSLECQVEQSQVEKLKADMEELRRWASGALGKRKQLQADLAKLTQAVQDTEERAATVAKDAATQVASARTDMRRMAGLGSETEALLERVAMMEGRMAQAETVMAKRIGDLLAGSIDRVSALRVSSERNGLAVEELQRATVELGVADRELAGRLLALEAGRARLLKTVSFAADLKPKVFAIRRDLAALESLLSDLTLRVGHLAQDMGRREVDIGLLRDALANLSATWVLS